MRDVVFQMTGGSEEDTGPEPSIAWCNSTSVGNKHFEFQWQISDYQRKKESVKRDDSIQSSTFAVQVVWKDFNLNINYHISRVAERSPAGT